MRLGRNDPCPCGSGRKFKKCHGAPRAAEPLASSNVRGPRSAHIGSYAPVHRTPRALPRDEAQFRRYIAELDADLASRGVPASGRQVAALLEAAFDQGIRSSTLLVQEREPRPGVYEGEDLAIRLVRWYEETYGDGLKVNMSPGSTAVVLLGEVWEYRFPFGDAPVLFFARDITSGPAMYFEGERKVWLDKGDQRRTGWPAQTLDVTKGVVGLPRSLIPRLSESELRELVELYSADWPAVVWLNRARHHQLVNSALADFGASIRHVVARPPELGQARWSSQQGMEKLLKSCLAYTAGSYPKGGPDAHRLTRLAELLGNASGPRLPDAVLNEIDCKPGMRYGEEPTGSVHDVVRRARIALCVGGTVAAYLCQRFRLPGAPDFVAGDIIEHAGELTRQIFRKSGLGE